jgi:hypothetical protein
MVLWKVSSGNLRLVGGTHVVHMSWPVADMVRACSGIQHGEVDYEYAVDVFCGCARKDIVVSMISEVSLNC